MSRSCEVISIWSIGSAVCPSRRSGLPGSANRTSRNAYFTVCDAQVLPTARLAGLQPVEHNFRRAIESQGNSACSRACRCPALYIVFSPFAAKYMLCTLIFICTQHSSAGQTNLTSMNMPAKYYIDIVICYFLVDAGRVR